MTAQDIVHGALDISIPLLILSLTRRSIRWANTRADKRRASGHEILASSLQQVLPLLLGHGGWLAAVQLFIKTAERTGRHAAHQTQSQFGDASQLGSIGWRSTHGHTPRVLLGLPFDFRPLLLLSYFGLGLARLGVLHGYVDGSFDRLSIRSDLGWLGLSSTLKFIRALVGSGR